MVEYSVVSNNGGCLPSQKLNKMRVFIGSSREVAAPNGILDRISGIVFACGIAPIRWNGTPSPFRAGKYTYENLEELSESVDAAIFICSPDDKTWYRGAEYGTPRDNVILEYGLFSGKLSRHKSIIIKFGQTRLPNDLNGLTHIVFNELDDIQGEADLKQFLGKLKEIGPITKKNEQEDIAFIKDGFIGLQRRINEIESDTNTERGVYQRLAVLGHLPSYMRLTPLSKEIGQILYYNWEPEHFISEYVDLVNKRAELFKKYIENGGIARDILFKTSITNYVANGFTFHDKNEDPIEEIQERLKALLHYNSKSNYFLYLLDEEKAVPKFLLKSKVGLVIDIRTTGVSKHFTDSIDGLFTKSDDVLQEFSRKFTNLTEISKNRVSSNQKFLQDLLEDMKSKTEGSQ